MNELRNVLQQAFEDAGRPHPWGVFGAARKLNEGWAIVLMTTTKQEFILRRRWPESQVNSRHNPRNGCGDYAELGAGGSCLDFAILVYEFEVFASVFSGFFAGVGESVALGSFPNRCLSLF